MWHTDDGRGRVSERAGEQADGRKCRRRRRPTRTEAGRTDGRTDGRTEEGAPAVAQIATSERESSAVVAAADARGATRERERGYSSLRARCRRRCRRSISLSVCSTPCLFRLERARRLSLPPPAAAAAAAADWSRYTQRGRRRPAFARPSVPPSDMQALPGPAALPTASISPKERGRASERLRFFADTFQKLNPSRPFFERGSRHGRNMEG